MSKYTETEQEVMDMHQFFWQAYADRDIDRRISLCSDDITFIGTGLHERAKDKNEYRTMNENGVLQFPDSFQIRFFQPFFTTKPAGQGTGLGLSISYDILKAHGGELKIGTKEREGAKFTIQLPLFTKNK